MVHTFPNLSVLFSGRVHISLDNTGEGGAGVQTMLLHQITRVLSTLSAAASPAMILSLNTRGYNQQIFSGSNEIFSWHHDTG